MHKAKKENSIQNDKAEIRVGNVYNSLKIIDFAYSKKGRRYWRCKCLCGKSYCKDYVMVRASKIKSGEIKNCPQNKEYINLYGMKFGKLKALYPYCTINKKQNKIIWTCICDCGQTVDVVSQSLRLGTTQSCGCIRIEHPNKYLGKPKSVSGLNYLYSNYKIRSKKINREMSISLESFKRLTSSSCHYCFKEPSQIIKPSSRKSYGGRGAYTYNGLDRKDSSKGYIEENVVPCCKICNRAKMNLSYDDFIEWIRRFQLKESHIELKPNFSKDEYSVDQIKRLSKGVSGMNNLISRYKARAKLKKMAYELTHCEFKMITSSICHYCKIPPLKIHKIKSPSYSDKGTANSEYAFNGIDRMDNLQGYTVKNCVPCCQICNYAKLDMDYKDFLTWIDDLRERGKENIKSVLRV